LDRSDNIDPPWPIEKVERTEGPYQTPDLDIDYSDLKRCIQFAKKYPELSTAVDNLSWRYIGKRLDEDRQRRAKNN